MRSTERWFMSLGHIISIREPVSWRLHSLRRKASQAEDQLNGAPVPTQDQESTSSAHWSFGNSASVLSGTGPITVAD